MELLVFILLIVVVGVVVYVLWKKRGEGSGPSGDWPFYAKRPLSAPSKSFTTAWSLRCRGTSSWRKSRFAGAGCQERPQVP